MIMMMIIIIIIDVGMTNVKGKLTISQGFMWMDSIDAAASSVQRHIRHSTIGHASTAHGLAGHIRHNSTAHGLARHCNIRHNITNATQELAMDPTVIIIIIIVIIIIIIVITIGIIIIIIIIIILIIVIIIIIIIIIPVIIIIMPGEPPMKWFWGCEVKT